MTSSTLLVIDVQSGLIDGAYQAQATLDRINQVIAKCRNSSVPVVFIQHCHSTFVPLMKGTAGWEVHPALHQLNSDTYMEKTASDAFFNTHLDQYLAADDIDHLIIVGLQTEYCVDTTCRAAISRGYTVTLIADGHTTGGTRTPEHEVIAHHNDILANLAHPTHAISVVPAAELIV